jgi:hypothetical protein
MACKQERTEHDFIFQALALVDGDNPHQILVAFQPQLLFLILVGRQMAAIAQPLEQPSHARMGATGDVQQFRQMQHIGQTPLAVAEGQQTFRAVSGILMRTHNEP